jgi:D-alanine-D-alanine ligase
MNVCILSDEEEKDFNPEPFMDGYNWEMITMSNPAMDKLRVAAESKKFDVYLNLCEGYEDDDPDPRAYFGIDVVNALEALELPFTGADSKFFDPSRDDMQKWALENGINFVRGCQVEDITEVDSLINNLHYPLIVKHPNSYGSTGLIKDSRVGTHEQLKTQVNRICSKFGAARVEEFIVGKEYSVFVVDNPDDFDDPIVYPPIELIFPPGEEFWHADVKWNSNAVVYCEKVSDPDLIVRLQAMACRMYLAMDGIGYARCDIRRSESGELFLLEINPNAGIMFKPAQYGPADCMILYNSEGYKGFLNRMFHAAILRHKRRSQK